MANLLSAADARLAAILTTGYGNTDIPPSTTFTDHCKNVISIPSATFRLTKNRAPLYDPALTVAEIDRAISLEWSAVDDGWDGTNNTMDTLQTEAYTVEVYNGAGVGINLEGQVDIDGSESASEVIKYQSATVRAMSDANRIYRALEFGELYGGIATTSGSITEIRRLSGARKHSSSGNGKLILVATYRVMIEFSANTRFAP